MPGTQKNYLYIWSYRPCQTPYFDIHKHKFSDKSGLSTQPLHPIFILLIVLPSYPISIVTNISKTAWHPEQLCVHLSNRPWQTPYFDIRIWFLVRNLNLWPNTFVPPHPLFIILIVLPSYPISIVSKLSKSAWQPE